MFDARRGADEVADKNNQLITNKISLFGVNWAYHTRMQQRAGRGTPGYCSTQFVSLMISRVCVACALMLGIFFMPSTATAQDGATFKAEFLRQFNTSARKFIALAEAMPADKYAWSPDAETMTVEEVFMHIAKYNYNYPYTYLDTRLPESVDLDGMEQMTGKTEVVKQLRASVAYVQDITKNLSDAELAASTRLYGRDIEGWNVLFQLITHMNEHLGLSIAYARINGVTPPWSR